MDPLRIFLAGPDPVTACDPWPVTQLLHVPPALPRLFPRYNRGNLQVAIGIHLFLSIPRNLHLPSFFAY